MNIEDHQKRFPVYVKKWVDIGRSTERLDYNETVDIIHNFQTKILQAKETPVIIMDNPMQCWVGCCIAEMGMFTLDEIPNKVYDYFHGNPDKFAIESFSLPYQTGSLFASTFSFYNYIFENCDEVKIDDELKEKYDIWQNTSKVGCIYPLEHVCFVSEKPTVCKSNEEGQMHCEDGPAINYAGFPDKGGIFMLYGIRLNERIATAPASELTMEDYTNLKVADQKMAFIRKVGIERFVNEEGVIKLDTYENYSEPWWTASQYELYDMNVLFPDIDYAPHLKMLNQTTGVWHFEAVSPDCTTLEHAINERLGGDFEIVDIK